MSYTLIYEGDDKQVLMGNQPGENKKVVIKVWRSEFLNATELLQLQNEYEITSQLNIPEIRKVLRKEMIENRHALVMEYYNGETLHNAFIVQKQSLAVF